MYFQLVLILTSVGMRMESIKIQETVFLRTEINRCKIVQFDIFNKLATSFVLARNHSKMPCILPIACFIWCSTYR